MKIDNAIYDLTEYGVKNGLIGEQDRIYVINRLLSALGLDEFELPSAVECTELEEILSAICDTAFEKGIIADNGVTSRDLFDTEIMGLLTPYPSTVIKTFREKHEISPEAATDYFYDLAKKTDYIRTYRVKKDLKWVYNSEKYGDIEITVNLSKPEKDPRAIAAAKSLPQSGYPKCALCIENEGFAGNMSKPARQNIRLIPLTLDGEDWRMQYSPYVYYNEHCIVLNALHTPMKITGSTFRKLLAFVEYLPHYFIGSNADLPIVGGSILSHDHMQGGRHTFAMAKAPVEREINFTGYGDIGAGIVKWPMSVIRLCGADKERMAELAYKILVKWRGYSDPAANILAKGKLYPDTPDEIESDDMPHNTITPIARRRGDLFELDLVLRNNVRTAEHPLGLYHPHAEVHNIKKENIGLIEVMGLAVLPSRLKIEIDEMKKVMGLAVLPSRLKIEIDEMKKVILAGGDFASSELLAKHAAWFNRFKDKYTFTEENTEQIIRNEIGATFEKVLEHSGVYKCTPEGRSAFMRFIDAVNEG